MQEAQARRNAASKEVGQAKAKKDEAAAKRLMDEVAALKGAIQTGETDEKRLDDELRTLLATIPNTPAADVPVGPMPKPMSKCASSASRRNSRFSRSSISRSARRLVSWISRRLPNSRARASWC